MEFTLDTSRLKLVPFHTTDLQLFHQINTHPFVRKYLWDNELISKEQAEEILDLNAHYFKEKQFGLWRIIGKSTQQDIGYVGLWYFFEETQPQLLYVLLPENTGKSYGFEAAQAIVNYAFGQLNFTYLIAACDQPNSPSQKLALRLGMEKIKEEEIDGKVTLFFKVEG